MYKVIFVLESRQRIARHQLERTSTGFSFNSKEEAETAISIFNQHKDGYVIRLYV